MPSTMANMPDSLLFCKAISSIYNAHCSSNITAANGETFQTKGSSFSLSGMLDGLIVLLHRGKEVIVLNSNWLGRSEGGERAGCTVPKSVTPARLLEQTLPQHPMRRALGEGNELRYSLETKSEGGVCALESIKSVIIKPAVDRHSPVAFQSRPSPLPTVLSPLHGRGFIVYIYILGERLWK